MGDKTGRRVNLDEHSVRLEEEQQKVLTELARLREHLKAEVDADVDEADPSLVEREKVMALVHVQERKLEAINWAMKRVRDGVYGICERCGSVIDPGRLEIFPEATLCIRCKAVEEREARLRSPGYEEGASPKNRL